jgi:thioredoxin 1
VPPQAFRDWIVPRRCGFTADASALEVRGGEMPAGATAPAASPNMSKATVVTDATFEQEVLQADKAVLVDFWAEWCGPCKMVSPVLEEIASEHEDKLTIVKLNVDENPDVTRRYGVMSIPTMALFVSGNEKKRIVGAMPKRNIVSELSEFIS